MFKNNNLRRGTVNSHRCNKNSRSLHRGALLFAVLFLLFLTGGCASTQYPAAKPPEDSRPVLRLGAIPSESSDKVQDQYKDFLIYLEKQTGYRVELVVSQNYNGIIEKMRNKELDFAVDQLKGHSFAFIDPDSTSGFLVPKAALMKQGIDPDRDFSKILFLGQHDAAIIAVYKRTVDAAAVSSNILKSLLEKGIVDENEIRVIFSSPPIPQSLWTYREGISPEIVTRVKQAFLNAHLEPGALGVYAKDVKRFIPREDSEYDIIRETAKTLNYKGN